MEREKNELDLLDLLVKGVNMFRFYLIKGWNLFLLITKFHIKNIFILLPFLIIGVLISVYQTSRNHQKQYCEFMLQVDGSNSFVVSDLIKVLNQTVNPDTNNVFLANALGLNNPLHFADVRKIYAIESFYVIDLNNNATPDYVDYDNKFVEDTISSRMKNLVAVRVCSKGAINFSVIQQRIVAYLKSDPYMQQVSKERLNMVREKIRSLGIEIAALDSLRKQQLMSGNNNMTLQLDNKSILLGKQTSSYYKDMMFLKDQKAKLEENLTLNPDVVSVYSGVTVRSEKDAFSIYRNNILFLYLCGILMSILFFFRKEIKSLFKN